MWKIVLMSLFLGSFCAFSADVHRDCSAQIKMIAEAYKGQILPQNEFYLAALYGVDISRPDHRAFQQAVLTVLSRVVYADMESFTQALNKQFNPLDYSNNPT